MNIDQEMPLPIPQPRFGLFDQQSLKGQVDQLHRPDEFPLAQLGSGIERNTFEAAAIGRVLAHGAILVNVR
jgi:hypothetical protein